MATAALVGAMAMTAVSGIMQAQAQKAAGKDAQQIAELNAKNSQIAAEFQAKQAEKAAGQDLAVSQREATEKRRQAQLASSRALAVAAASGGGALDSSVVNVLAGFDVEGDLAARGELYLGKESASARRLDAAASRYTGDSQAQSYRYKGIVDRNAANNAATGTLLKTGASMASMYAMSK